MPASFPPRGLVGWDDELKTYVDTTITEAADAAEAAAIAATTATATAAGTAAGTTAGTAAGAAAAAPAVAAATAAEAAAELAASQAASSAALAQDAAVNASEIALGDADATLATAIGNPASQTRGALSEPLVVSAAAQRGKRLRAAYNGNARRRIANTVFGALGTGSVSAHETNLGAVTGTNADDTFTTASAHGLVIGDRVRIAGKVGGSFINGLPYYVRTVPTGTTFTLFANNASSGGIADLGSDVTSGTLIKNPPTAVPTWNRTAGTVTITASTDTFATTTEHGLMPGDNVYFTGSTAAGVANDTRYFVKTTPTSTTFTVSSSLAGTGPTLDVTGDGTATLSRASTRFVFTDGRPRQRSTVFPGYDQTQWDVSTTTVTPGTNSSGEITAHTIVTDLIVEIDFYHDGANAHHVYVDGMLIDTITSAQLTSAGISVGSNGRKAYTFDVAGRRLISVRTRGSLAGFFVPFGKTTERPVLDRGARWQFVGDSFTEGTGATLPALDGYVSQVRDLLGLKDVWACGSGSTGYTVDGTRQALIDRYTNDVIAQQPDVLVIAMGLNDSTASLSTVVADATTIWDAIISSLPNTELIVVGPFPNGGGVGVTTAISNLDTSLANAARERGLRFISPVQDGLTFTLADATHPNTAGHAKIGTYLAGHLATPALL